ALEVLHKPLPQHGRACVLVERRADARTSQPPDERPPLHEADCRLGVMRLLALVAAAAFVFGLSGAYGRSGGDPGVTSDSVLIGGTVPLSGDEIAYAAVARGADAYFHYVNDHGGVRGRKIHY